MKLLPQIFSDKFSIQTNAILSLLLFATITRIGLLLFALPIPNFSPVNAMMLLCGAYCINRLTACAIALFTIWCGDLFINQILYGHWVLFYPGFFWQYATYGLIVLLGSTLRHRSKPFYLLGVCLSASTLFFIISNFGVWWHGSLYPQTVDGLITCYLAAIPFYKNTLLSDLFFSAVFFSSIAWLKSNSARWILPPG